MRSYACKEAGFELCLDLVEGERKTTLYSKKGWRLPGRNELPHALDRSTIDPAPLGAGPLDPHAPRLLEHLLSGSQPSLGGFGVRAPAVPAP